MNEFFRCPKPSGHMIIGTIILILVFMTKFNKNIATFFLVLYSVFSIGWFGWSIWNIKQAPECYQGFSDNTGWSYLNPFSFSK